MAQKIHGMTLPSTREGRQNERVQDAVDVLLFRDHFSHARARQRLRKACVATFVARKTHAWPPKFEPPESWREDFAAMASDLGMAVQDLDSATEQLREFIRRIAEESEP